jgi:hypothetical protein
LQEDHYPDVVKIIASNISSQWELNGFIINNGNYEEVPLIIIGGINIR